MQSTKPGTFFSYVFFFALSASATSAAQAHHAFATEFDASHPISFTGKVVKVELINPHSCWTKTAMPLPG